MNQNQHTLWNEKYRPQTLDNYLCTDDTRTKIQEFLDKQDIPHIGLFGIQGSGKSTLAKLLVNNIDCDFIYVNATEHRGMDDIKEKVGSFASARSFKPLKIVILDEATHILQASQVLLLNMIETYSLTTRFILTGNYPERLIPPLRSRLQEFKLFPSSKKTIAKHVANILDTENVDYELEDIVSIINYAYPDFRKIINSCQKFTINNKLSLPYALNGNENFYNQILEELKTPNIKTLTNIRQIIADSDISDFDDVYRFLYDNIEKYASMNMGEVIIYIEEYQYHSNFKIDKEINFCAFISRILPLISKKKIL
jgi:DNA polymerase III delta prime subunit